MYVPFIAPPDIRLSGQGGWSVARLPQWQRHARGRHALALALDLLRLGPADEVLVPASLCSSAIKVLHDRGIGLRHYPLDARLAFSVEDIASRVSARTRAIYAVHFFGFPGPLGALRRLCDEKGVALIEDAALCLYRDDIDCPVGRVGDVAIFSLWKFTGLPDGAILLARDGLAPRPIDLPPPPPLSATLRTLLARCTNFSAIAERTPARRAVAPIEIEGPHSLEGAPEPPHGMSSLALAMAARCNQTSIAEARRINYQKTASALADVPGIDLIWDEMPKSAAPYCTPILVDDAMRVATGMCAAGIVALPAVSPPLGPPCPPEDMGAIAELTRRAIALPVHQGLSDRQIAAMVAALRRLA